MRQLGDYKCPKCDSEDFITQPNRYDCLKFANGQFQAEKSEFTSEKEKIFCRECGDEVDVNTSLEHRRIILENFITHSR